MLVTAAVLAVGPSARAAAEIAWSPCHDTNDLACGHLTVPLDPSGGGGETITLAMRRHLAPVGGAREAVIALAGGPGQAAIPFTGAFTALLGPILSTRDLIVFDQRGIGMSNPLSCAAFENLGTHEPSPGAVSICAKQIGARRGFYETADTGADIEAIRQAGGYEKLVLYGTSYGTKVAERYAQRYPTHVAELVLDSVVLPNGPDPMRRSTFAAIRRVVRGLCSGHACAHITHDSIGDLARLVRVMHRHPVSARAIDDHGHAHHLEVTPEDMLDVLFQGDFNPLLRAELPAAVHSARTGDEAPLARMLERAEREGEGEPSSPESLTEGFDVPLYFATTCEEQALPFSRSASPSTRRAEAAAQVRALPAGTFAPFDGADALATSDVRVCSDWPYASPAPELDEAPMPAVPTLIFSGEDDIRTPTADARALASQIPGAQLVVVAHTGHSALTTALAACPRKALEAFFANKAVKQCTSRSLPGIPPLPLAPRRLSLVAPAPGTHGRAGRALHAVLLTLADFANQSALGLFAKLPGGKMFLGLLEVRIGGLRAGWGSLSDGVLRLHRYTYVPTVAVSGTLSSGHGTLRVGGPAGVRGTLRLTRHHTLVGVLGGERVGTREILPLP
ncbi:MAG: alpha/beta hydrolase [Solirubrobacteraceae bacterium]